MKRPDVFDAKTFWNQIVWGDTRKALSSSFNGQDITDHNDNIQVLRSVSTYHFDDACVCFVKDKVDNGFIQRLKALLVIFNDSIFDLIKMDEQDL